MGCSGKVYCWHSINAAWYSVCLGHCNQQGLIVAHLTDRGTKAPEEQGRGCGTRGHSKP